MLRAQRFLEDDDDMMKMCLTRKKLLEHANASSGAGARCRVPGRGRMPALPEPCPCPSSPSSPSWLTQAADLIRMGAPKGTRTLSLSFFRQARRVASTRACWARSPGAGRAPRTRPSPNAPELVRWGRPPRRPRAAPDGGAPAGLASAPSHSLYGARRSGSLAVGSLPRFSGWQGGGTPSSPTAGAGADGAAENDDSEESIEAVENLLESYFMQIDASYDRLVSIGAPHRAREPCGAAAGAGG
jgi:hypothetical protein